MTTIDSIVSLSSMWPSRCIVAGVAHCASSMTRTSVAPPSGDREGARQRSEQDVASGVGIRSRGLGECGDAQLQIGQECGQRARSAADMLQQRLGVLAEELVEHLGKGLIRQQRFLVAAAGQNDGAARTGCRQDLADQARLADTGFAVDDDETPAESGALDRVLQRGELTAASDECAARRRHPRGEGDRPGAGFAARGRSGARREIEVGILAQDRTFEGSQRRPGVDAQLFGEQGASILISAKRVGLTLAAIQRDHQLRPALSQRVQLDVLLDLGEHVDVLSIAVAASNQSSQQATRSSSR